MTKQSKPANVRNIRVKPMSAKHVKEIDRRAAAKRHAKYRSRYPEIRESQGRLSCQKS